MKMARPVRSARSSRREWHYPGVKFEHKSWHGGRWVGQGIAAASEGAHLRWRRHQHCLGPDFASGEEDHCIDMAHDSFTRRCDEYITRAFQKFYPFSCLTPPKRIARLGTKIHNETSGRNIKCIAAEEEKGCIPECSIYCYLPGYERLARQQMSRAMERPRIGSLQLVCSTHGRGERKRQSRAPFAIASLSSLPLLKKKKRKRNKIACTTQIVKKEKEKGKKETEQTLNPILHPQP